jgi:thymidylate synthase
MKNGLDEQYIELLKDILENGVEKETRNGKTLSVFGRTIRYKFNDGKFPLLTTKRLYFKGIVTELLWFLRGDTNIKYLVDNGCNIWNGDCYQAYKGNWLKENPPFSGPYTDGCLSQTEFIDKIKNDEEFSNKFGELGKIYGAQWRNFGLTKTTREEKITNPGVYEKGIDQIANLINDIKTNPDSRRLMVTTWNPSDLQNQVLPPCHYGFQVYTRELSYEERCNIFQSTERFKIEDKKYIKGFNAKLMNDCEIPTRAISLMWNQRSVDTFLGLPFNIASYGLLLEIIAKVVNMVPDELIGNLGDTHLYSNHIEQAKEQIGRELTGEERYNEWFRLNYETGMERNFNPNNLPNYDDEYYEPTPKRTREPYPLPTFDCPALDEIPYNTIDELIQRLLPCDFEMEDYQSHPTIKAPLSN